MLRSRVWADCRWPDLAEAAEKGAVVIVPVGSIEQHGFHLPVRTDALIAHRLALMAADRASVPVIVAPTIEFGYAPYHLYLPGTISLRQETLTRLLNDVCRSIHAHGFRRIFLLNGHGGNQTFLASTVQGLAEEGIYVAAASWWTLIKDELEEILESELGGANHAGELETSVLLHLAPELVEADKAVKELGRSETIWGWKDFRSAGAGRVDFPITPLTRSRSGVYGDPLLATSAKGISIVGSAVGVIVQVVQDLFSWNPESPPTGAPQ